MLKEFMSVVLALGLVLGGGCTAKNEEKDLTDKVEKQEITAVDLTSSEYAKISPKEELTQFSIELLQENFKDKKYPDFSAFYYFRAGHDSKWSGRSDQDPDGTGVWDRC